jgi:hypothetical protein
MGKDLIIEQYQAKVYDIANKYDLEPIFIDYAIELLAHGYVIEERNFIKGYFVRLAASIMKETATGLKSRRPEIVAQSQADNTTLHSSIYESLSTDDKGILLVNVALMEPDGQIRYGHVLALNYAKQDVENIKGKFEANSIEDVIKKKLIKELDPIIPVYKKQLK